MNRIITFVSVFCFLPTFIWAQNDDGKFLRIKNGSLISEHIAYQDRYLYSEFRKAKVLYANGKIDFAEVNYNILLGEVQFISAKKDTLNIADPELIRIIAVENDAFYFVKGKGHLILVRQFSKCNLVKSKKLMYSGTEKYAAYGQYSSTSAITTYSSIYNGSGANQKLPGSDMLVLKHQEIFYLRDHNGKVYPALRSSFFKLYKGHKTRISQYFDKNPPIFDSVEYLFQTLTFCDSLLG